MNSSLKFEFVVNKADNTIVVKREFAANLELVWEAWTTAEILDQWWAPEPCKAESKAMDFREGGHWLYCMMIPPENQKKWGRQNYEKIVLHEKFSGTDVFCDENGIANPEFPTGRFENVFSESDGKTLVTVISRHNSFEEIEMVIQMGFKEGLEGLTARIAPNKPMKHAIILGIICVVLTIAGLIAMWDTPPRLYPVSLIVLTLPAAWIGGKMAIK